ncbi:hypothetical protein [Marinobacter pelagius]|uniref:hypothetical protein n=1 Tax=Marinobacter pelagius TaxID=379482 RepID=UPI001587146A|nr:hypothetical protein [Marinobacter pelagius]
MSAFVYYLALLIATKTRIETISAVLTLAQSDRLCAGHPGKPAIISGTLPESSLAIRVHALLVGDHTV